MMNDDQDAKGQAEHLAALRYTYGDGEFLRRWIAQAAAGKVKPRAGQLERWRAALATLEQAQGPAAVSLGT